MIETDKWEDIKNDFPYLDILYLEHPTSKNHPRQSREARAGQFSPFAALTGYGDAVKEVSRYTDTKLDLEEEERKKLDEILQVIKQKQEAKIKITYFEKDKKKEGGKYLEVVGIFQKVDSYHGYIQLMDKTKIPTQDIVKIEIMYTQE